MKLYMVKILPTEVFAGSFYDFHEEEFVPAKSFSTDCLTTSLAEAKDALSDFINFKSVVKPLNDVVIEEYNLVYNTVVDRLEVDV